MKKADITKDKTFISIHRKLFDWEWYQSPETFLLWIHCLLKANHTPKKWQGIPIKRGQFITSFQTLSKETGLSLQTVRTCIKRLKSTQCLTWSAQSKYSLITIIKYDDYQKANTKSNIQSTRNQHATNMQLTSTNNDNNDNNDNLSSDPSESGKKENKKSNLIGKRLDEIDWKLSQELGEWCESLGMDPDDIILQRDKFLDHYNSKTDSKSRSGDWDAVFRNFIRYNLNKERNQ